MTTTTVDYLKNAPWLQVGICLVLSPAGVMTIIYSLPTLGVADWLWVLLCLYSFVRDGLGNASNCPTAAGCVSVAMETCLDKPLCSSGCLCDTSVTPEF